MRAKPDAAIAPPITASNFMLSNIHSAAGLLGVLGARRPVITSGVLLSLWAGCYLSVCCNQRTAACNT
jgi:hypothetical protein